MSKVYAEDIGTAIRLDTKVDISAYDEVAIHWERDDGTTGVWEASVVSTTKVRYVKDGNEVAGTYTLHSYAKKDGVWEGLGDDVLITFYEKYK